VSEHDRARAMAASVVRTARSCGVPAEGIEVISRAHAGAMEPRVAALADDHHPAYLHPGRSVLILLRDVGPLPSHLLAAASVHETEDAALRVDIGWVRSALGERIGELVASLPSPGSEDLLERLVTLDPGACLVALAERLDHLRHAHLRDAPAWWRTIHEEAGDVWLPVAERAHPRLGTRFRHWHRAFARRVV